jgi:S-adenosylmethionine:tRNA ribosyltransferase-isomerase
MRLSDFDYDLPPELIAQRPADRRDAARLLVHAVGEDRTELASIAGLGEFLRSGDLLVLNDTRVLPARLFARRESGGRVELLLAEPVGEGRWRALVRPAKKPRPGERLAVGEGALGVRLLERLPGEDGRPGALWELEFEAPGGESVEELLEAHGELPLPPYIEREEGMTADDRERYQTVYARVPGAVAAPTAGLHFTDELLAELRARGVRTAPVTLHVGLGTFLPVSVEDPEEHRMHAERYSLPEATAEAVRACRAEGGRVIAVGTTSVRVLETCAREDGTVHAGTGSTRLFLRPGHGPRVVDGMLTNFHLPRSTLLMLVAAFAGTERVLELYERAVRERLRFYSYGDAMLLLP